MYMNPERVFWGMIENSLATKGVTTEVSQTVGQGEIKQLVQFEAGTAKWAHSLSVLKNGNTEIKTEVIGTQAADYTRYRSIKTDQKNSEGKPIDAVKVLNVWSKSDDIPQSATQSSGHQLLAQAVLGVGLPIGSVPVPIGALTPSQRADMVAYIRSSSVYTVSFDTKDVKKERKNGRLLYTYNVNIQTIPYARLMKEFAKNLGMHELDAVDPNAYQTNEPISIKFTVDAYAKHLAGVDTGQGYKQAYKGHGLALHATPPDKYITAPELRQRINEL